MEIELGGPKRRAVVTIDDCSLPLVLAHKWYIAVDGYAWTTIRVDGKKKNIPMHRMLMNAPKGMEVDHRNGVRLDNRMDNMRLCSHMENMRNRKTRYNNKCGLKGVTRLAGDPTKKKIWSAQIGFDRKNKFLGNFWTPEEAHEAYKLAAERLHGDFSRTA